MIDRKTIFSPDRVFRYTLWRDWGDLFDTSLKDGYVQFIGLNPSTADEVQDDPTIRRCIGFTKAWGYGTFCMTNLFGFRATDPKVMKAHPKPSGPDNIKWILEIAKTAGLVIAAWGNDGAHQSQSATVRTALKNQGIQFHHLGLTGTGEPKHPLYLRADLKPIPF